MRVLDPDPDRLKLFSDAVFAVIITVLVLDLRPPEAPTLEALFSLWPTGISYAVSYLFIAIVWTNHHHMMLYAKSASWRLIWVNFAHLFAVSLLPFTTAWIADSELAPLPVSLYAGVFFLVNATYVALWEVLGRPQVREESPRVQLMMRMRYAFTMGIFACAAILGLRYPAGAMTLICFCLILYLRP